MGEIVSYRSNSGSSEGYVARPATGAGPGVIVIQEWWGLVPHIKSLADRFAQAGFVALAPDLYHGEQASEPDEAGKLMMGLAMDQAAKDIAGAADYLTGLAGTTDHVGTVGFCMGGSLALWSATLSPKVVATVGFYPPVPWERMAPTWSNYAGKAALIHCSEHDGTSAAPGIKTASASPTTIRAPTTRSSTMTGRRSTTPPRRPRPGPVPSNSFGADSGERSAGAYARRRGSRPRGDQPGRGCGDCRRMP
jgi:carboxymethylenebutenolidase